MKISIIGIGRVGGALAIALSNKGHIIEHLVARDFDTAKLIQSLISPPPVILSINEVERIDSEAILITTQDSEIAAVAGVLAAKLRHQPVVLHTSGSRSSDVLSELSDCPIGSIHPLVSVSDAVVGAGRFTDVFFCLEGRAQAIETGERLAADLGGKSFSIETESKTLYHAAAVAACGHLTALIDISIEMLAKCGVDKTRAKEILLPLVKSTVENLDLQSPAEALTGTFARADTDTLEKHLASINAAMPEDVINVYLLLGERSLQLAEMRGADPGKVREMQKIISLAKKNLRC